MSTRREFIARGRTNEEIAKELGADYLLYQATEDMVDAVRWQQRPEVECCTACFTGSYPTGDVTETMLSDIEEERLAARKIFS